MCVYIYNVNTYDTVYKPVVLYRPHLVAQEAWLSQLVPNYVLGSMWISLLVAACEGSVVEGSARLC